MSAVEVSVNGSRIEIGTPRIVADSVTFSAGNFNPNSGKQYAVTRDGQRFLLLLPPAETRTAPITMILNWTASLKK
jgi:hypothetical protein